MTTKIETRAVQVGVIGIDTGRLILCDPCYVEEAKAVVNAMEERSEFPSYASLGGHGGYRGAIVTTGRGDGIFPVIAHVRKDADGYEQVVRVEVTFITESGEVAHRA